MFLLDIYYRFVGNVRREEKRKKENLFFLYYIKKVCMGKERLVYVLII